MPKRYLVTGGSGFLGSALVRRLVAQNHFVRVLDDNSRGNLRRLQGFENKIEFVNTDIRDASAVANACKDIDSICHLAYINGTEFFYTKPELILDIAVSGMMNVLNGAIAAGVKELILASSSEVYQTPTKIPTDETTSLSVPDPLNPRYSYGGGKIISELLAINYGRKFFEKVVIFRPHNVYGPDMGNEHVLPQFILRMAEIAKKSGNIIEFPIQGNGEETRSFVFVDDFIDGVMLLLEKGEHLNIYNIGTLEELKISEVAKEVGIYFGKEVKIIAGSLQSGSTLRRCPDISKISKLGYAPQISFREGLPLIANWYNK